MGDFRIGIVLLPDDLVGGEIDAQQVPELADVALGRGRCWPIIIMGFMPPGGCRGMLVGVTSLTRAGQGSSKMAVGCPLRTAARKLAMSSGASVEGCTASSTS